MAETLQIEIGDDGEITGDVPTALDTIFKRIETNAKKVAFGEGVEQAAKDAKKQIEETVAHEKAMLEARAPYDKQRLEQLETDHATLAGKLTEASKETDRVRKALEEQHAKDLIDRASRLEAHKERIRTLTRSQIRAEALQAGARDESLDELEIILQSYMGYTDDMEPFVKGPDGKPLTVQGKEIGLSMFVKDYLDKHPHHRKVAASQQRAYPYGQAASMHGLGQTGDFDAAMQKVADGDRSASAINAMFEASRARNNQRAGTG